MNACEVEQGDLLVEVLEVEHLVSKNGRDGVFRDFL